MSNAQIAQALSPEQSDYLLLFTIETKSGYVLRLCSSREIHFQGDIYEFLPNTISGLHESNSGEMSRPVWNIANPEGILTRLALDPELQGATVTLIRVLESDHEDLNYDNILVDLWRVYRTQTVSTQVALELRKFSDFPKGTFPYRGYYPPDFKTVELQ